MPNLERYSSTEVLTTSPLQIRFNPNMPEVVPKEQLDLEVSHISNGHSMVADFQYVTQFGGDNNYKFDHTIYWNTLVKECYLVNQHRLEVCFKCGLPFGIIGS